MGAVAIYEIYGIVNNVNNKIYVGQSRQGHLVRFKQHLERNEGCRLLNAAIEKYGKDSFTCELLDIAYDQSTANEKEIMWIRTLKTYISVNGYNLSMGGVIGTFNNETRKRMSESKIGRKNNFYGKTHKKESKQKMSAWKKKHYLRENHPGSKKVRCVETGKIYDCVIDASEDTGANKSKIGEVANKKYGRKTAGGYRWEWV